MKTKKKISNIADNASDIFGSGRLDVPQCYLDEAKEWGCEVRWVSAKELKENYGSHKNHWTVKPFKSKPSGILGSEQFAFGTDPEGVVRRGDAVLAVRPTVVGDQHRKHLAERRKRYNRFAAQKKKEFKDYIKQESKGTITVDDKYDGSND